MIKVFNATDKNYATHGDLILQPSKAVVHKEDNGEFYLDLETSLNEKEYKNTTPEAGQTIEGTNFSINVDTTKQYEIQTLKGQITQNGTPTPSSPIPINITTGRQVVGVCKTNKVGVQDGTYTLGNLTFTITDGVIEFNGTTDTATRVFFIPLKNPVSLKTGETNTFYVKVEGTTNGQVAMRLLTTNVPSDDNSFARTSFTARTNNTNSRAYTQVKDQEFTYLLIQFNANQTINFKSYIQLNSGSSVLDYEKYNGLYNEINLGKQLFDISRLPSSAISYNNGFTLIKGTHRTETITLPNYCEAGTYTLSFDVPESTLSSVNKVGFWAQDNGTNILNAFDNANHKITFTATARFNKFYFFINNDQVDSATITLDNIQLEKGNYASRFSPYKTPIYLGEIGNYKDYIFRNTTENPLYDSNLEEGQWYIHKEIGRVVLNGSENWKRTSVSGSNSYAFWNQYTGLNIPAGKYGQKYCDRFEYQEKIWSQSTPNHIAENNNWESDLSILFNVDNTIATTLQEWKTWLSTHNTEVYYVLNTPTNTLIEDEELINQLNSIQLLEGLNNVSVSSANLPAILQLKYNFTTAYSNVIKYIDYLAPNNILVANTPQGDQAFRITNIEKTRRKIKLRANHVFYDSLNYLIADSYVVDKNCNDALDHLNNATSDVSPFTTISDITNINSFRCVRKSLYEAIKVVLERWGGHLVRNDWTIGIYNEIGQDNGVTIRYAKNLKDISATYDWNDVVTKILPVGKDGILLNDLDDEQPLYIESTVQYDIPYTKSVSFEQNDINEDDYKDEDGNLDEERYKQALIDDLYNQAAAYVSENSVPKVNYNLSANVEKVSDVGDRIEVIDEKLGINLMTRIISFDYDCILEKYTNIEFGNFMPKLSDLMSNITASTEQLIQEQNSTLAITLNRELTDATDKIWNALGNSYVIYDGDKILIVDSLPKETARNVIMLNNGGIGFSNNGINGTFNSAWTIDNVLNMEQINVINLTADLIKGGTLKLGSSLNQNGQLEVYDEANNLLAVLDKNGLRMNGADGSYVIMNNDVGFAGFDRLNNKIYWVDKDVFHQKKSEVEEEITLVKKMRIIPITITDSGGNIVNDGIGFVNVGGGN